MRHPKLLKVVSVLALLGASPLYAQQTAPANPPAATTPAAPPVTPPATPPATPATPPPVATPATPAPATPSPAQESAAGPTEVMLEPRPVLILTGESTWDDGYENLNKAFDTLKAEAKRLNLAVTGKPLAAFQETDDQKFKYDAMVILEKEAPADTKPQGGITIGKSLAGKAFRFNHVGAYDDIDSVYEAITAWLDEKGLTAKGAFVEEYVNAPQGSDDSKLELNIYVFVQ